MPNKSRKGQSKNNRTTKSKKATNKNDRTLDRQAMLPRTVAAVQNNLQRPQNNRMRPMLGPSNIDMAYAHCRLDPFMSAAGASIPDASPVKRLVVDYVTRSTITQTLAGDFDILITPTLPNAAMVKPRVTNSITLDGSLLIDTTPSTMSLDGVGWFQSNVYPEWATYAAASPTIDMASLRPIAGAKARLITVGWRITYIGAPLTASGMISATETAWSKVGGIVQNQETINVVNSSGVIAGNLPDAIYVQQGSLGQIVAGGRTRGTVSNRVDQGMSGVLKVNDVQADWKEMPVQAFYIGASPSSNSVSSTAVVAALTNRTYGSTAFWDDRFNPTHIRITGAAAGSNFILETITCIEVEPDPNTLYSKIATVRTHPKPLTSDIVEKVIATEAIARPLAAPSLFNKFMTFVSSASKAVAPFTGPVGPIFGAVSSITEAIANL